MPIKYIVEKLFVIHNITNRVGLLNFISKQLSDGLWNWHISYKKITGNFTCIFHLSMVKDTV